MALAAWWTVSVVTESVVAMTCEDTGRDEREAAANDRRGQLSAPRMAGAGVGAARPLRPRRPGRAAGRRGRGRGPRSARGRARRGHRRRADAPGLQPLVLRLPGRDRARGPPGPTLRPAGTRPARAPPDHRRADGAARPGRRRGVGTAAPGGAAGPGAEGLGAGAVHPGRPA